MEGCLAANCTSPISGPTPVIFTQLFQTLLAAQCNFSKIDDYPPDRTSEILENLEESFDFIIVGAGTAGSVLASRLSEQPNWKVLLIEAGTYPTPTSDVPGLFMDLQKSAETYYYLEEPQNDFCLGMIDGRSKWTGGKAVGGGSSVNGMVYLYGNPSDYDSWAAEGNPGWSYDDVLPYFKKSNNYPRETIEKYGDKYLGTHGPVSVRLMNYTSHFQELFSEAVAEIGVPKIDIFNTDKFIGFGRSHMTANNGRRVSTAKAYLSPVKNRKNLFLMTSARADLVLINNKQATGVRVTLKNNKTIDLRASKEVIVSAGVMESPKLLMLSGIGPKEHLEEFGIKCLADLPVGKHLQDHLSWQGIVFEFKNQSSTNESLTPSEDEAFEFLLHRRGKLTTSGGLQFMGLINVENSSSKYPDIQFHAYHSPQGDDEVTTGFKVYPYSPKLVNILTNTSTSDIVSVTPVLLKPKSSGEVKLRNKSPRDQVKIFQNYLADNRDKVTLLKSLEFIKSLLETKTFKGLGVKLREAVIPGCDFKFDTPEYWECNLRHTAHSYFHAVGTARMGPSDDPKSVVDSDLKVLGIDRLRVIDASIMPNVPAANPDATTLMIAEKGADIIKNFWLNHH